MALEPDHLGPRVLAVAIEQARERPPRFAAEPALEGVDLSVHPHPAHPRATLRRERVARHEDQRAKRSPARPRALGEGREAV